MKIAIAGYGVEGEANYSYWSKDPGNELTIVDEQPQPTRPIPAGAQTMLGEGVFERLDGFDLVIRTPALRPDHIKTDGKVWSATNEFFAKCQAPIIGVTGSKGKGTTSSLIASILEASGKKVWLVGNIGQPSLEVLDQIQPDHVVVYELSSFQLWDLEKSPHTAVVLFIEQEHQDVHESMEEYVQAKANIAKYQTPGDIVVYNAENEYASRIALASAAQKIPYPNEAMAHIREGYFYNGEQKICSIDALKIRGEHNQMNALAAIDAVWEYVSDAGAIERGLGAFSGLPHRLAYVRTVGGVEYYDDSIATTPTSAIAALRSFTGPKVIILGGHKKGSDFSVLAQEMALHDVQALLIGDEAEAIAAAFREVGFEGFEIVSEPTMPTIVGLAAAKAKEGGVVLLSPAAASFGLFKDYKDRGDQFVAAVNAL